MPLKLIRPGYPVNNGGQVFTDGQAYVDAQNDAYAQDVIPVSPYDYISETGVYSDPDWLVDLSASKVLPSMTGQAGKVLSNDGFSPSWSGVSAGAVTSFNSRTGAISPASGDYNANKITNAVDTTSSYADPSWITSVAANKVLPTMTGQAGKVMSNDGTSPSWSGISFPVTSFNSRTGAITPASGDYNANKITNAVDTTSTYNDPAWLTGLGQTKTLPSQTSATNKALISDGTTATWQGTVTPATFLLAQGAIASTGVSKTAVLCVPVDTTITKGFINAKIAPSGASLIVDINKNGTSIWASTQANRLQLPASGLAATQTSFDTTSLTAGDLLTIDIDQVGSTYAGQDVTVTLLMRTR